MPNPEPPEDRESPTPEDPYAGRWVARLGGRVVGQGGTPEQALQAAQIARFKERPQVNYIPSTIPLQFPALLESVRAVLPESPKVYLVGGAVRDALIQRPTHDLDFVVAGDALRVARKVANALQGAYYNMNAEFATGRVILVAEDGERQIMDFATLRGPDLESDLRARDFTLNAMAIDVHHPGQLLDPLGGSADLASGRLRACANTSFQDDPLRIIRAIRAAATYTLHILPETRTLMKAAIEKLPQVSPERLRDELFKLLEAPKPTTSLRALDILGVLPYLLPELPALKDVEQSPPHIWGVWTHTLYTLEKLKSVLAALAEEYDPDSADELMLGLVVLKLGRYRQQIGVHLHTPLNTERSVKALLYLAALYHDVAKPETRSIDDDGRIRAFGHEQRAAEIVEDRFSALRLSNAEIERAKRIVRNHMRPHSLRDTGKPPTRRVIYRFFRDTEEAGVDVVLLSVADLLATYGPNLPQDVLTAHLDVCRALLEAWFEHRSEKVLPPAVLDGHDLMVNFDLEPGPIIGELLEAVREAQAMGEIEDRKAAFKFVGEWLQAH